MFGKRKIKLVNPEHELLHKMLGISDEKLEELTYMMSTHNGDIASLIRKINNHCSSPGEMFLVAVGLGKSLAVEEVLSRLKKSEETNKKSEE